MTITDEMDDFINEKSHEWYSNQDRGCNCPSGNPPCSYCEGGYSIPLAEYIELALEWEYGDDYAGSYKPNTKKKSIIQYI